MRAAQNDWFAAADARKDLAGKSVRGTVWGGLGRWGSQLVGLVSLVALARLLTPSDFGVVAMVMAVVGLIGILQDLGFSAATVRFAVITHAQVSNLFWINVAGGLCAALAGIEVAPLLQVLYGDSRVKDATIVLAIGLAVSGLGAQHRALLTRNMRFAVMAAVSVVSAAVAALVSVAGALAGLAHWALIWGVVAGQIAAVGLAWACCDWRPGAPQHGVGTRDMVAFGGNLALFGLLGFMAKNLHSLLIGKYWGAPDVGVYGKAANTLQALLGNVVQPVGQVAPPALSRLTDEAARYAEYYLRACATVVMVVLPVAFVGLALSKELILVAFGPQWLSSAPLLQVLSCGVLAQAISGTTGWVFLSSGRTKAMLMWGIAGWTTIILGTLVGSRFGVLGIAVAAVMSAWLLLVPNLIVAFRSTPLRVMELGRTLTPILFAGLLAGAGAWALLHYLEAPPWLRIIAGGAAFLACYGLLLFAVGLGEGLREILGHLRRAIASP